MVRRKILEVLLAGVALCLAGFVVPLFLHTSAKAPIVRLAPVDPKLRITAMRRTPQGHLEGLLAAAGAPQGTGAWMTIAGLDGLTPVALKVSANGTLATGADPGGAIQGCTTCVVVGGLSGLSSVALKVGADGTVATSGSAGTIAIPATVSGATSGGIPCFDSATDMNTSAVIASGHLLKGGGAGACVVDAGFSATNVVTLSNGATQTITATANTPTLNIQASSGNDNAATFEVTNGAGSTHILTVDTTSGGNGVVATKAQVTGQLQLAGGVYTTGGSPLFAMNAPTISTHFNTSGDSIAANGTLSFTITVGTGTGTSTGAISLPSAAAAWTCWLTNQSRADLIQQTASATNSATFTNFGTTFAATNWTNSDVLNGGCTAR